MGLTLYCLGRILGQCQHFLPSAALQSVVKRVPRRAFNRHKVSGEVRIHHEPLIGLITAHRGTYHGVKMFNIQMLCQ